MPPVLAMASVGLRFVSFDGIVIFFEIAIAIAIAVGGCFVVVLSSSSVSEEICRNR